MSSYTMPWRRALQLSRPEATEIALILTNGVPTVSSRDIAAQFDKAHDKVMRDIRELELSPELATAWFVKDHWTDSTGRSNPMVHMTKDGFTFLCMGWTGEKAAAFKVRYILAFNEMEAQLRAIPVADPVARLERMVESLVDAVRTLLAHHAKPAVAAPAPEPEPVVVEQPRRRRRTQEEMDAARDTLWGPSRFMSAKAWTREHGHNAAWNKSLGILASKIAKKEGISLGAERRKDYRGEAQYVNTYPQGLLARAYAELMR